VSRELALGIVLALVLAACWPFGGGSSRSRLEGRYLTDHPGKQWRGVDAGGADKAWWHSVTGATLYTDSNCEKAYSDSSLSRLARAQSAAIDGAVLREAKDHQLAGRAAYTATFDGRVDGVAVAVTTTVMKKGKCIYDFVLVAPVSDSDEVSRDYEALVASFRIKK
jgi:hypothetical protein